MALGAGDTWLLSASSLPAAGCLPVLPRALMRPFVADGCAGLDQAPLTVASGLADPALRARWARMSAFEQAFERAIEGYVSDQHVFNNTSAGALVRALGAAGRTMALPEFNDPPLVGSGIGLGRRFPLADARPAMRRRLQAVAAQFMVRRSRPPLLRSSAKIAALRPERGIIGNL